MNRNPLSENDYYNAQKKIKKNPEVPASAKKPKGEGEGAAQEPKRNPRRKSVYRPHLSKAT